MAADIAYRRCLGCRNITVQLATGCGDLWECDTCRLFGSVDDTGRLRPAMQPVG